VFNSYKELQMECTELQSIEIRLRVLKRVVKAAQEDGDNRWKDIFPQIQELERQRAELMQRQGVSKPEPITIQAKIGTTKARGLN
jgi:hypothetical protein